MKTYEIVLMTPKGLAIEIYCESEDLQTFEKRMIEKYKHNFIMYSSGEIKELTKWISLK